MAAGLGLCGASNPMKLLRMALIRVGLIMCIQERKEDPARTKEFSREFVSLCRVLGGLRSCYLKPRREWWLSRLHRPGGCLVVGHTDGIWNLDMSARFIYLWGFPPPLYFCVVLDAALARISH